MKLLQMIVRYTDGISNELLKYAAGILSESFAEIINTIFEQHIAL